ncbi:hypothetical protein K504DRAFT_508209 [Pleomassaria siparia CBS 279.74]|uniref:Uncharacterized protein n=1 Tax=Pleomassaria siparia CBS 279.74 TaxID=1314801 RepID=A0A6G1JRQ2_9PLEO|nr:hypothetical protein K504DRAFT_508209 [Pleomassaria siparia CBS 279.74]
MRTSLLLFTTLISFSLAFKSPRGLLQNGTYMAAYVDKDGKDAFRLLSAPLPPPLPPPIQARRLPEKKARLHPPTNPPGTRPQVPKGQDALRGVVRLQTSP